MASHDQNGAGLSQARVKSVLSGDTIILTKLDDPKKERTLSLAYVTAPRLKRDGDEHFAFESRDYLRKALVGRTVTFKVLYTIPTTQRQYGVLFVPGGGSFPDSTVADGWVKLRDDAGRKDESPEATSLLERLQVSEARARADGKGIWQGNSPKIDSNYELQGDVKAFVDKHKGKSLDGIVEKVLTGDRLIVRLLVSPTSHVQTMLLIAGVKAPSTKRANTSDGKEQPAEPFGDEAQLFIETRLLQRNIQVDLLGVSPQNQLVGSIKHPTQGSIAPHVLRAGLARCTDFHSTLLGSEMGVLRTAEKEARDAKRGVYTGHTAKATSVAGEIDATVSRILSADTIFLRNKAGAEKRVSLSSVRQPKPSDPKQAQWGAEAREFLRKKLIGKHVKCKIDGKRSATEGYEEREMATVSQNGKNIGLLLVENGFASVIRHRHDDPDRSPIYDELLVAEQKAQDEQKGMWNPKDSQAKKYIDYSESLEKAKRQLTLLSKQKRVPAVVDYVKSASRFTVLIPREDSKITFVLSGIRAPKSARSATDKAEPFGQEAHDFANKRALQRDVEIDVDDVDKVGGFIGSLYINRESFAKTLVEEGLASVHAYSAEKSGNAAELFAAEKKAKEQRKGIWKDWDPSQDGQDDDEYSGAPPNGSGAANGADTDSRRTDDYRDVMITHIDESGHLKLHQVGSGTAALEKLEAAFRSFHISSKTTLPGPPKAGDVVAAKFSADGLWYRAKIRRNDREKKEAEVVYLDYGNSEHVPWSSLRPLGRDEFNLSKLAPQATDAVLSFIQLPGGSDYLADAIQYLTQATDGQQLVATVDNIDKTGGQNLFSVTLFDPTKSGSFSESINAELVAEGWALVPRKLKRWELAEKTIVDGLRKQEQSAKADRKGQWEYGDITADD